MIRECADVPQQPDSLIQMVRAELERALALAPAAEEDRPKLGEPGDG
jgi:hypothetical protein